MDCLSAWSSSEVSGCLVAFDQAEYAAIRLSSTYWYLVSETTPVRVQGWLVRDETATFRERRAARAGLQSKHTMLTYATIPGFRG